VITLAQQNSTAIAKLGTEHLRKVINAFALGAAEVIGLPFMLGSSSGGSRFYVHAADRIFHSCCAVQQARKTLNTQQLTDTIAVSCLWLGMMIHRFCDPSVCPAGSNPIRT
jgi:hypothetical protein